jgi:uncharacterized protein (DUF433 family)
MAAKLPKMPNKCLKQELVTEMVDGDVYEYYPLGKHVVAAPGVCGGRPTIKYTRIDARHVIGSLKAGESPKDIARDYRIPLAAIKEAVALAREYDYEQSYA